MFVQFWKSFGNSDVFDFWEYFYISGWKKGVLNKKTNESCITSYSSFLHLSLILWHVFFLDAIFAKFCTFFTFSQFGTFLKTLHILQNFALFAQFWTFFTTLYILHKFALFAQFCTFCTTLHILHNFAFPSCTILQILLMFAYFAYFCQFLQHCTFLQHCKFCTI